MILLGKVNPTRAEKKSRMPKIPKRWTRKQHIRISQGKPPGPRHSKKRNTRPRRKSTYKRKRNNILSWAAQGIKYGAPLVGAISKLSGFGDYHGTSGAISGGQIPIIQNTSGGCIVRHREYLGDLSASQGFVLTSYNINPGNPLLFPWLSGVANNFEQWCPRGMIFEYKSMSSDTVVNVTSGSSGLGSVIMATDYNVYNPDFSTKQQMENYEFAVSCKPSQNMIHMVENKKADLPLKDYYITDSNEFPAQGDARMTFPAKVQIATVGNTTNTTAGVQNNIGEIWCSYEVELKRPRILPGQPAALNGQPAFDHFNFMAISGYANQVSPQAPFSTHTLGMFKPTSSSTLKGACSGGIVPVANQSSSAPGMAPFAVLDGLGNQVPSTANTYYFPKGVSTGRYMLSWVWTPGTTTPTPLPGPTVVQYNCSAFGLIQNNVGGQFSNAGSATNVAQIIYIRFIEITGINASISFSFATGPPNSSAPTAADLYISQLPENIN